MRNVSVLKKIVAPLAAVALVATSMLTVTAAAAAPQVISSADFEDGTLGGWEQSGGGAGTLSVIDFDGGKVLQVADRDQDYVGVQTAAGALAALTPGETYTFTMRARLADGVAGTAGVRFVMKPAYTWIGNTTMSAGAWTTVSGTYTVPAGTDASTLQVYLGTGGEPGTYSYLVDDLEITGPPGADDPVVVSALDFEDDTTGTWTQSGGGAGTLSVISLGGSKVLQVANRDQDYVGIQSPTGLFEPGVEYTLSMKARLADDVAGTAGVRFVMKPSYSWIGNTSMSAADWTTVTGTFLVPADANPAELQVYLGTGGEPGTYSYLVDDIVITKPPAGPGPDPDPDFVPGGAVNPTTTPVSLAQGTGNVAALTFDDGPNGADTTELLDYLAAHSLHATFCVIGQNIQAPGGAAILQRIVADGHTLCNHTTSYADMGSWSASAIEADLKQNLAIIRTALGDPNAKVPFFRAPNGSWGATPAVAVALGMQPLAVVNTINDWVETDPAVLTANLRAAMKPGEVVLMHDGGGDRGPTIQAVKTVVGERLADGWTFTLPAGAPPAGGSVAISTDFEDGLDGWNARDNGTGAPTVAITTGDVHGGLQAAAITGRTSQGSGMGHDVTGVLTPGVTYELNAWLKFVAGQGPGDVWLTIARTVDGATTYQTLGQFTGMSNSQWVEVTQSFTMGAADSAYLYFETSYNGTNTSDLLIDDIVLRVPEPSVIEDLTPIKDTVDFPVGVAIDSRETVGSPSQLLLKHFDQVTSENFMKPEAWYDANGVFTPNAEADTLMEFAQENDLAVYGHTLVWHSQTPAWFFQGAGGAPLTDSAADQQILKDRMHDHIFSVAEYLSDTYGEFGSDTNPLYAFDVVNEVVADSSDFSDGLRRSEWYRILGEQYIDLAFQYANDAFNDVYADADADHPVTLFINDYNSEQGGKQQRYHALVERLLARDVPVDGVGHQFHVSLSMPVTALDAALDAFEDTGLKQAVTEFDVTIGTPVTQANLVEQGYYFRDAFRSFREHSDDLFSVTAWGLTDGRSWRAASGAPLIFNDALQAKPAYFGIVDTELPGRLRTANVFQGDVPPVVGATTDLAWRQLPLQAVEDSARFQLRWEPDHLSVYVDVDDASVDGSDALEFEYEGETVTFARNGTGDVPGVVQERSGGYSAVVRLPLASAVAQGGTLQFDLRVTDGGDTVAWNTPGSTGTLTLLEPLSYVEIPEVAAAPAVDGVIDAQWTGAPSVTTGKLVQGTDGASANVRTLWKGSTLYVLAQVTDPIVDVSGSDPWIQDSLEIYLDAGNFKNGSYRYDDTQIRISAANATSFGTGDEAFQSGRLQSATQLVPGGYVVEAAISLLESGGLATFHGLDFQVNDASGGARTGIRNWADPSGIGYQSTARWGVAQLVAAPVVLDPQVTVTKSSVAAGGKLDVKLEGFQAGTVVQLALQRGNAANSRISLGTVTIGPAGTASVKPTVGLGVNPGNYKLVALADGVVADSVDVKVTKATIATIVTTIVTAILRWLFP